MEGWVAKIGKGAGLGFWERRLYRGASLSGDVGVGCRPPIGGRGLIGTALSGGAGRCCRDGGSGRGFALAGLRSHLNAWAMRAGQGSAAE